jgi:serine/threonine protein kinase
MLALREMPAKSAVGACAHRLQWALRSMAAFISKNAKNGGVQLAPGVPVRAGQVLSGKYRVEELLGCSATAIVVTARHVHLRHAVTLKILTAYTDEQLDLVKRQVRKARVASRLRGDHVARIVDIGTTEDGMPYIATERLDGHTLATELEQRGGRLPIEEALQLGLEICEGLAEAHAVGLVHGDLKTKNLFVADGVLKILDFGMASPIESTNDASATAWFGKPSYLAPEQIKDPASVDHRADIWSLGVILHELISGSLPFTADTVSGVLVAVCCDAAPLLSEAPYELARVVHRCLEKDPNDRPASVEELAKEIGRFLGEDGKRASERVRVTRGSAALVTSPPSIPRPGGASIAMDDEVVIPSAREPFEVRAAVPSTQEDRIVSSPRDLPSAPVVAPVAQVPPPPHTTPRSVFARPKGFVLPNTTRAARSGQRLPGWLPGGRDPSVISSNDKAASPSKNHDDRAAKSSPPPSLPPPKTDETYMRNLFTERK